MDNTEEYWDKVQEDMESIPPVTKGRVIKALVEKKGRMLRPLSEEETE